MKLKILFLLLLLFPVVSAIEGDYLGSVKVNECATIYNFCPTCTYMNLTAVKYPNELVDTTLNEVMNKSGNDYTYNFCNTSEIGDYFYTTCGNKGGASTESCEEISFDVTPSGFTGTLGFYIIIFILSFGVIALGFWFEDASIMALGSFGLVFVGLYILFNGIDGLRDPAYTLSIGIITTMLGAYIGVKSGMEMIN